MRLLYLESTENCQMQQFHTRQVNVTEPQYSQLRVNGAQVCQQMQVLMITPEERQEEMGKLWLDCDAFVQCLPKYSFEVVWRGSLVRETIVFFMKITSSNVDMMPYLPRNSKSIIWSEPWASFDRCDERHQNKK